MQKRLTAGAMAVIMLIMTVVSAMMPTITAMAAGTTLIIHYSGREDNS